MQELLNKIICGDSLSIMKQIPDKSIDLVLTDPPYEFISKNPVGGGFMKFENKKHLDKVNNEFGMSYEPTEYLNECKRICRKFNGYFFTNKELVVNYINWAKQNDYKRDILIRNKDNPIPIFNGHWMIDKEYIIYIKESGAYFNSKLGYENYKSIFKYPIGNSITEHPTEKPVNLFKSLIQISSDKGQLVFDGYMGSGTTAVACKELGRNYIGIEKESKYCKIAENRLRNTTISLF